MHWKAYRNLPALLDGGLRERDELDLRVHVASCARCRRVLRELELAEALVRRIPTSILPLEASPASYGRLTSLSRWSAEPELPDPERWRLSLLGAASVVAIYFVAFSVGVWAPSISVYTPAATEITLIDIPQDSFYVAMSWRQGRY